MSNAAFLFQELLTWQAILDISIITALLFFLYRTLLRLGTLKILIGILAAFLLFTLASILNLEGIKWILQNVSHVAVLALIVIFQPELRKIFEKLVSLQTKKGTPQDEGAIEIVTESLLQLAKQKRGAIVVYPGNEPVKEKLSGGHRLSAEPSIPLIMSIFDPNSPGHDGAMIIEDNRLTLFGVRLPISQTSRLAEEFGTRHHAAMGLAELTDALVLVVSEERGIVSAFREGSMKPLGSRADIINEIRDHRNKHGFLDVERLGTIDRRTFIPIAASLVVAGIFWTTLVSVNREVVEKIIPATVEYKSPSDGLVLVGEKAENVKIHLAGPKSEIDSFILTQPTVTVDLSNMAEGRQTILITRENLQLPRRISFLDSNPAHIEITLAGIVQVTIPVEPQLVGNLPSNLKIKKIRISPAEVQVLSPPPKRGDKPLRVSTTPIYLSSITSESRIFCKIIAPATIQPAGEPWQDVEVTIEVEERKK